MIRVEHNRPTALSFLYLMTRRLVGMLLGINRGGDRQRNRALHTIVMVREAWHEPTKRSVARRTAQGKSQREIRRCLTRGGRPRAVSAAGPPDPRSHDRQVG